MASQTVIGTPFPSGATVSAYTRNGQPLLEAAVVPGATLVDTSLAGASGSVTFDGLTEGAKYWAVGQDPAGAWRWVAFRVDQTVEDKPAGVASRVDDMAAVLVGAGGASQIAADHASLVVVKEAPLNVEHAEYGASPSRTPAQNSASIALALAAVPAAGGDILFPRELSYDTPIALTDGRRLLGVGAQQRWRAASGGTVLTYTGTGQAVKIQNPAGGHRDSIEIHNIRFDGTGLAGSVDGLFVDGTAGGAADYVECVKLVDAAFTNFPRYQLVLDGLVIDVTCDRCAFNNVGTPNGNALVRSLATGGAGEVVTQLTFNDCLWAQYGTELSGGAGAWCYHGDAINVRFVGGTATTNGQTGGSGFWLVQAAVTLLGTHLEGITASKTGVGIRRTGANPAFLAPSYCAAFTTGIQNGDPASPGVAAVDTVINGMVGGNTTDVQNVAGGSRRGFKIIALGEASGSPAVVTDSRRITDGVWEMMWLHSTGAMVLPRVLAASAPNNSLYVSSVDGKPYWKDNSGVSTIIGSVV